MAARSWISSWTDPRRSLLAAAVLQSSISARHSIALIFRMFESLAAKLGESPAAALEMGW
jgi:hypothetical protein